MDTISEKNKLEEENGDLQYSMDLMNSMRKISKMVKTEIAKTYETAEARFTNIIDFLDHHRTPGVAKNMSKA